MNILGMLLLGIGGILSFVGGIWFLVIAFKEHILWGIGCLIVPFVSLVFLIMHFAETWKPFVISMVGTLLAVAGVAMTPGMMPPQ